jgi:hypothetical protein
MSATTIQPTSWPPHPRLRELRREQRLLAAITDDLDALGRGHRLLVVLLAALDQLDTAQIRRAVSDVDQALATSLDHVALLEAARALPEVRQLLERALDQRTSARNRLRRLTHPHPWPLEMRLVPAQVRAVVAQAHTELVDAGRALVAADRILTDQPAPKETP